MEAKLTYDTLGRVDTATNALSGTAFSYSYLGHTGRVASVTEPNGQSTVYTYQDSTTTAEPRLSEIKNLNASSAVISKFNYGYDAQGQITSWTQQTDSNDPQNWALQYDNVGRLINATVTDTTTSALLHQYAYRYDAAGNRTGEQIDGSVTTSSYNNLNQLTGQSAGGPMVFSGSVSKYSTVTVGGNPASLDASNKFRGEASVTTGTNNVPVIATDVNGNASTNTYQVVVPSGGSVTNSYDYNGNLLSDGTRNFAWDAKNELVSIVYTAGPNNGNHTEFTYNGLGQRVKIVERTGTTVGSGTVTSTKQFVWEGSSIAEERDASNVTTKRFFAQGEQRISGGTPTNYFYTRDHLGSIREMIAGNGTTISARYSYDPYGRATKVSGSLDCDFQYAGYYEHATSGLNLTMFRAYNPNTGTWISRDPSGEGSGLNLYAYCGGDPINKADPSGLNPLLALAILVVVVGAGLVWWHQWSEMSKAEADMKRATIERNEAISDPNNTKNLDDLQQKVNTTTETTLHQTFDTALDNVRVVPIEVPAESEQLIPQMFEHIFDIIKHWMGGDESTSPSKNSTDAMNSPDTTKPCIDGPPQPPEPSNPPSPPIDPMAPWEAPQAS